MTVSLFGISGVEKTVWSRAILSEYSPMPYSEAEVVSKGGLSCKPKHIQVIAFAHAGAAL